MSKKQSEIIHDAEKEFLDVFKTLCYSRNAWQVWTDLISAMACSLSNATDRTPGRYEQREKEYEQCIKRLGSVETPAKLMAIVVMALERNPEQDFLGKIFMNLNLGSHWKGQFFTPYSVCKCMSEITIGTDVEEKLKQRGYIAVCDPACGAGATLIAAANVFRARKINYQNQVLFVAQDIDRVAGLMCYIQLSLLGCPGYIVIADTLTNPIAGATLAPIEGENQEFWYTPFFSAKVWQFRRTMENVERLIRITPGQEAGRVREEDSKNELAVKKQRHPKETKKNEIAGQLSLFDF